MVVVRCSTWPPQARPLHDDFADKAAAVDGEMVDVINNMPLVRAFCGLSHEHDRFDATVKRELDGARTQSSLPRKAADRRTPVVTVVLTIASAGVGRFRCGNGARPRTGDVVLVCTLGLSHPERDARSRSGAGRCDPACRPVDRSHCHPVASARTAGSSRGRTAGEGAGRRSPSTMSRSAIPAGLQVFDKFSLRLKAGQRVGLVGQSGGGKSSLVRAAAAVLRRPAAASISDRRPGHLAGDPAEPARGDFGRAAGYFAVPPLDHGKYPLRTAERDR